MRVHQQKTPSPVKPQKKFLRKGQGLARFNMKPTVPKKQKGANQKTSGNLPPLQQVSKTQKEERNNMKNPPVRQETKETSKQLLAVPQNKVNKSYHLPPEQLALRKDWVCSPRCLLSPFYLRNKGWRALIRKDQCLVLGSKKDCWKNNTFHNQWSTQQVVSSGVWV